MGYRRLITALPASMVFASVATTLTAIHPFIHHIEGGVLDSALEYLYIASLDAMGKVSR